jgi:hypothetical protein
MLPNDTYLAAALRASTTSLSLAGPENFKLVFALACLRWSAADLAKESALGANTIRRAEVAEDGTSLTAANELAVRRALEAAGVEFIDENGGGAGVRLRKPGGKGSKKI